MPEDFTPVMPRTDETVAEYAARFLAEHATPELGAAAQRLVDAGTHVWIHDPEVWHVYGLVEVDNQRQSVLTIWADDQDFEHDYVALPV